MMAFMHPCMPPVCTQNTFIHNGTGLGGQPESLLNDLMLQVAIGRLQDLILRSCRGEVQS